MPRLLVDISPLRTNREFRLLYLGQVSRYSAVISPWSRCPIRSTAQTHSSLWVGLASLIQLPFLITGALWGGAMGDRVDKRILMLLSSPSSSDSRAPASRSTPTSTTTTWSCCCLLAALSAGFAGFSGPLRTAAIPKMVMPEQLVACVLAQSGRRELGGRSSARRWPACFIASVGLYSLLRHRRDHVLSSRCCSRPSCRRCPRPAEHAGTAMLRAIGDGFRYVRSHAVVQAVYLVDLNAMVFGLPRALFPAVALTLYHGGPRTLGLLYAAPGAGALLMAVVTGWIARVRRQGRLVAAGRDGLGRGDGALRTGARRLVGSDLSRASPARWT